MTDTSTITPLSDHAVVVNSAQDNVAVVKHGVPAGLRIRMPDGRELTVAGAVGPGHRFATTDVRAGHSYASTGSQSVSREASEPGIRSPSRT